MRWPAPFPSLRNLLPVLLSANLAWAGPPTGETWLRHLRADLLPYWAVPEAFGVPVGNFPTFRCNDGRLPDSAAPCPEVQAPPRWIKAEVGRTYVRMQGRQTYAYGVAFHLTGDRKWLDLAKAGAAHTLETAGSSHRRAHLLRRRQGAARSRSPQRPGPVLRGGGRGDALLPHPGSQSSNAPSSPTSGSSFSNYWDDAWGMLRWVPPDSLKIHHWKSGFHSFEHALMAYLGAQALAGEPAVLHFATGRAKPLLRPYLMRGSVQSVRVAEGIETVRFHMQAPAGKP